VLDLAYNFSYKVLVDVTDGIHIVIRDLTRWGLCEHLRNPVHFIGLLAFYDPCNL